LTPPLIHQTDHPPRLAVVDVVEIVVVDIQLRVGVRGASGFKGDAHEVFAEDVGEYAGAEGSVFVEDFV
jgi:hypothetical protein